MKKIKFLTEDSIEMLKKNVNTLYREVIQTGEKSLGDFLCDIGQIKDTPFEIEDFILDMSQPAGKEPLTDAENAQRIYNHMKELSDSQASDERIWVAYTLSEQIEYMKYRWKATSSTDMLNRYFFNYSKNRSLFRNGISRLWWIGRVTYDEKREDPFELTKFMCNHQDFIETICGRSTFNNPTVQKATLNAIYDIVKNNKGDNRETIREVAKYVNLLAGTYILDMLDYQEIYDKVYEKLLDVIEGEV
ncbi:hypothetical protein EII25_02995 [Erysipelotrichaceae bacterium OH741_COT-311]|nr:hypothetical protein EII25_02995 [Erysipelotrichaceae bacterium OH741_COT-311]